MSTITSANAVFSLTIPGVFNTPVILEGYGADDAFTSDAIPKAEVMMGVDGQMSAGFVFAPTKVKIHLQADSNSIAIFETWNAIQQSAKDLFFANAQIVLMGPGDAYDLFKGALTNFKGMPDAKKTLQGRDFEITFQSVTQAEVL